MTDPTPSRDLWPLVLERLQTRARPSWIDIGLALAALVLLVVFPEWLVFFVYQL